MKFWAITVLCCLFIVGAASGMAVPLHADDLTQEVNIPGPPTIVINEVHSKPDVKTEAVEFIELFNPTAAAISLSGWAIMGGVDYAFLDDARIEPGAYLLVAENPAVLHAKFGVSALGPYARRLDSDGDRVVLRDGSARIVDEVEFGYGFPWPVVGESANASLQLIHFGLDNNLAGNWRSAAATPGARNLVYSDNPPPRIDSVTHAPQSPRSWQNVTVTAAVADADGLSAVTLSYQIVEPGGYIALTDRAYQTNWTTLPMQEAGAGLYRAELPADIQRHRRLVRYRVEAIDGAGQLVRVPYPDDPQPNFAYFVYDDPPQWNASIDGGGAGRLTYDFAAMRPLPIYHIIAKKRDVADAMHMPDSTWAEGYMGHDYLWRATLVYDGKVYDHITFRARGGLTRYATGKTMWKLNFNPTHSLQAVDDWGRPFATAWDKLNLSSAIQQTHRSRRGEQGMFESISFRLFNLAGVEAPSTFFMHFRVIDDAAEQGASQYDGDFWGLYLGIEQPDGNFLEEHSLPDGNFYKVEDYKGEKNNQGRTAVADNSDFDAFTAYYTYANPDPSWWRAAVDLARYYSYRSIIEAIHHYDVDQGKNFFYFNNPMLNKWSVHPWDLDGVWYEKMPGTGVEPFLAPVLSNPQFNMEYQNRLREVRDLLFNSDQMNAMLDEHANFIDSAFNGLSMVDADRAMWDHHPIYLTHYVDRNRTRPGHFYRFSPTRDFRGMVALMKQWVVERSAWIDATLLTDRDQPVTPVIYYVGAAGFPADQLRFHVVDFADPQGPGDFAAMRWRIAEVTDPVAPTYDPTAPRKYEIDAAWQSNDLLTFQSELTPPLGVIQPGRAYRVRVRMKDRSGRWSHWSAPVSFVAASPAAPSPTELKISEIMYNPFSLGYFDSEELEFIELQNTGQSSIDLSNVQLGGGINYRFPPGASLSAGKFVVIAANSGAFVRRYGFAAFGEFERDLGNSGDVVLLLDAFQRVIATVEYSDESPWPKAADGAGRSLTPVHINANPGRGENWRASAGIHGSPGAPDPLPILVNEFLPAPSPGAYQVVELFNPNDEPVAIGGWFLSDSAVKPRKYRIPDGAVIAAKGYFVIPEYEFVRPSFDGAFRLAAEGGELYLASASDDRLTGHRHGFRYGASETGMTWGRYVSSAGHEQLVQQSQPTLGGVNADPRVGPVVIGAITLESPASGAAVIALTNASDEAVNLFDPVSPQQTWELHGAFMRIPAGVALAPGATMLVTAADPHSYCLSGDAPAPQRVFGPFSGPLTETGQEISLWSARPAGSASPHFLADSVDFSIEKGWPYFSHVRGATLRKGDLAVHGNDPAHWQMTNTWISSTVALTPTLCSFTAAPTSNGAGMTVQWTMHAEAGVVHYTLRRGTSLDESQAIILTPGGVTAQGSDQGRQVYTFVDNDAPLAQPLYYWLDAVGVGDEGWRLGVTSPVQPFVHIYTPMIISR
jgi:hypothetical protein